jgi:YVTN family beta-propeller protein
VKKIVFAAVTVLSVLALGGCSLFYPNWGATGLPTATSSSSATSGQTDTPTPTPSDTASSSASPTPTILLSAEVQVVDLLTNALAGVINVGSGPAYPGVDPSGDLVWVPNVSDNTVSVIDTGTNQVVETIS